MGGKGHLKHQATIINTLHVSFTNVILALLLDEFCLIPILSIFRVIKFLSIQLHFIKSNQSKTADPKSAVTCRELCYYPPLFFLFVKWWSSFHILLHPIRSLPERPPRCIRAHSAVSFHIRSIRSPKQDSTSMINLQFLSGFFSNAVLFVWNATRLPLQILYLIIILYTFFLYIK